MIQYPPKCSVLFFEIMTLKATDGMHCVPGNIWHLYGHQGPITCSWCGENNAVYMHVAFIRVPDGLIWHKSRGVGDVCLMRQSGTRMKPNAFPRTTQP